MSEEHLESVILEENKKEIEAEEPVYIWDAISSIAKTVSEQVKASIPSYLNFRYSEVQESCPDILS